MAETGERDSPTSNEDKALSWNDGWKFIVWMYMVGTAFVLLANCWPR